VTTREFHVRHGLVVGNNILVANVHTNAVSIQGSINADTIKVNGSAIPTGEQSNAMYELVNAAFGHTNSTLSHSQAVYGAVNSVFEVANAAYGNANSVAVSANNYAGAMANAANAYAEYTVNISNTSLNNLIGERSNASNVSISSVYDVTNATFGHSNITYAAVNSAFGVINAAFDAANTKFSSSGGTVTGSVSIVGDLIISGNTRQIGSDTLRVSDPLIYLAGNNYSSDIVDIGFIANYVNTGGANVHTGLYREHENKEYYLFQEYASEPINNHIGAFSNNMSLSVLNADIRTSNLNLGDANAIVWIKTAFDTVNAAFASANNVAPQIAPAFNTANAAFGTANARVSSVSGTSGRITSSGGTAPTIDLATAGTGAASYSSGISALTVDAYGRVTSVTGSAGYLTGITSGQVTTALGYTPPQPGGTGASGTWGINVTGSAGTLSGVALGNFVYGDGARGKSTGLTNGSANSLTLPSGFYFGNTTTGFPTTDWWNMIACIGNGWVSPDSYGFQMAASFWGDDYRLRRVQSGGWQNWRRILIEDTTINSKYFGSDGRIDATIFYDSNDTARFIDPANGGFNLVGGTSNRVSFTCNDSGIFVGNAEGNGVNSIRLGAAWGRPGLYSPTYLSLMADSSQYIEFVTNNVQRGYIDNGAHMYALGSMRSPIFYDSNNTAYYVDPAGVSFLATLEAGGLGRSSSHCIGSNLSGAISWNNSQLEIRNTNGGNVGLNLHRAGYSNVSLYHDSGTQMRCNGIFIGDIDVRSPIFYDLNDTGYYIDPNADRSSNINGFSGRTVESTKGTYKYNIPRNVHTGDTNYWVGTMGWATSDWNGMADWGSGFIDSWGPGANSPPSSSHHVGVQVLHYTNGTNRYGWQLAGGTTSNLYYRNVWGGGFTGWKTVVCMGVNENNTGGLYADIMYDSNNTGFYIDPNSTSNVVRINSNYLYAYNGTSTAGEFVGGWGQFGKVIQLRTDGAGTQDGPLIWFHKGGAKWWAAGITFGTTNAYSIYEDGSNGQWGTERSRLDPGGFLYVTGNVTAYWSDIRLKKDVATLDNAIEIVKKLRGVSFAWNERGKEVFNASDERETGFIAQEVQQLIPSAVRENKLGQAEDGTNYLTIDQDKIVPYLVEAIKEQQAQIDELKRRLENN
jgi:hypothetical protein